MDFLTQEELRTVAPLDFVDILKGTDEEVIDKIITESIDVFKTYLGPYYDTEKIFAQRGKERNGFLLKNIKKLVIYELKARRKPTVDKDDYNEVMKWLGFPVIRAISLLLMVSLCVNSVISIGL